MGFYLRKSLNFGPVRLNLSKHGLGVSVGVPGLRIGRGPRGAYVHAGRMGLYYRCGLPAHIQHHGELSSEDMTPLGGLVVWSIVLGLLLALAALVWADPALAGTATCHTYNDEALKRLTTTCTDGSRSVTTYDEGLKRWDTRIITPPKADKPPPSWPTPGEAPR